MGMARKKGGSGCWGKLAMRRGMVAKCVCLFVCVCEGKSPTFFSFHLTEVKANKMPADLKTENYKTEKEKRF